MRPAPRTALTAHLTTRFALTTTAATVDDAATPAAVTTSSGNADAVFLAYQRTVHEDLADT